MSKTHHKVVLLSHSHEDCAIAQRLISALTNEGFVVWSDQKDLNTGSRWWQAIEDAIQRVQAIVLMVGPQREDDSTQESIWQAALELAWSGQNKKIIPFLLGDATGPAFLRTWETIRAGHSVQEWQQAVRKLIEVLSSSQDAASRLRAASKQDRVAFQNQLAQIRQAAETLSLSNAGSLPGKK